MTNQTNSQRTRRGTIRVLQPGHGFHRGQRVTINNKPCIVTRTKDDTFWYSPRTTSQRLLDTLRALLKRAA